MTFSLSKIKQSDFFSPLFFILRARKILAKPDFATLKRLEDHIAKVNLTDQNKVIVSDKVHLEDYLKISDKAEFELLINLANKVSGKKILFFNATPQGGGVALMRHPLIRIFEMLNVDAKWFVLRNKASAFEITKKKFHNILQAVAPPQIKLESSDKKHYNEWITENFKVFQKEIKSSDIIVIDDPQPCGLVPLIKKSNKKAKIIFRSHIHLETKLINKKGTPQNKTWNFIWENIKDTDCFVSHPIKDFIPDNVPSEKIVLMPATTDPLDGLNRPLTKEEEENRLSLFNKLLKSTKQEPLDLKRPYIIQVARFDPSKGIPHVIEAYQMLRQKIKGSKAPQLVICGNGSIDDPDGIPVYESTMRLLKTEPYKKVADDIKIIQLPHVETMLNALLRRSKICLQLSIKEGFEVKVTEALMKGKPVIAYRTGGIPLQIQDGITGFLVDAGDTKKVADIMYELLTDEKKYNKISRQASELFNKGFLTTPNVIRWLLLFRELSERGKVEGNFKHIY